jgi:nitrogen fixation protein FixH
MPVPKPTTAWAYVPIGLLIAMLAGLATLAAIAIDDPSFAVERDYYQKAISWDARREQERQNVALGWKIAFDLTRVSAGYELRARVTDRQGNELSGASVDVEAFHNARAATIADIALKEREPGMYVALMPIARSGLWEFRFRARRRGDRFSTTIRRDIEVDR